MPHSLGDVTPSQYCANPTFIEFLQNVFTSLDKLGFRSSKPFELEFVKSMIASLKLADVLTVLLIATVFTLLRFASTSLVFLPLSQALQVAKGHHSKLAESAWKLLVYTGLWLQSLYTVVLSGRYDFLQNPLDIFKGFVFGESQLQQVIPADIYWMYAMQLGFYVHSMFATLFMDVWRKDSVMMLLHHGLTIFLLEFSFLVRYYKIGALVLLLHDLSDILLEFTKVHIYLKDRAKRDWPVHEFIANLGFALFSISWAWLRLYWFPLKVVYTTTWGVYIHHSDSDIKLMLFFNFMLCSLQVLHIYWFYFILLLLYRVATGQQREVDDTREFKEDEFSHQNGRVGAACSATGDHEHRD